MDAVPALRQYVRFVVLTQELDLHALADLMPGEIGQRFLIAVQSSFGRSHKIEDGRVAFPHLPENLFSGNAPVHHPYALGLAVLRLDLFEKPLEGRVVGGVARHDFVGQGEPLRGHNQGNHHLHAVEPLVPAVAVLPLVVFGKGRIALEVRARQIIEEHVERRVEQILPAFRQVIEEGVLMFDQQVETPVELMDLGQLKTRP